MRKTTTVNLTAGSPLDLAVQNHVATTGRPYSVALREVAERALAEQAEAVRCERALRADLAGDTAQLQAARTEIAQLKQSVANSLASSRALGAELDRANGELERLREEFRTAHFRLKCSQEALAEAKAELETVHAARRAEAEAEDHVAEREAILARQEDLALREFALKLLADRAVRACKETRQMIEEEEV